MAAPTYMTLEQMLREIPPGSRDLQARLIMGLFRNSMLLNSLSFRSEPGAGRTFQVVTELPTVGPRALNTDFTVSSRGTSSPNYEALRVYGLVLRDDKAARQMGLSDPARQMRMGGQALRLKLEYDFVYGDPLVNPLQVGGFQYWAENSGYTAETSRSAGATSGGAALSVKLFRDAIDACTSPSFILMGEPTRNLVTGAGENTGVSGFVQWQEVPFFGRVAMFDNLPIVTTNRDNLRARILDFNEAASTGAATATSVYIVGQGPEGYEAFQNGPPDVEELAITGSQIPRELMWLVGNVAQDPLSVVRIKHIGNLPLVP